MKNVNKLKKEGNLGLTYTWGQNPLKIWGGKWQKASWIRSVERERDKKKIVFEKIMKNTC